MNCVLAHHMLVVGSIAVWPLLLGWPLVHKLLLAVAYEAARRTTLNKLIALCERLGGEAPLPPSAGRMLDQLPVSEIKAETSLALSTALGPTLLLLYAVMTTVEKTRLGKLDVLRVYFTPAASTELVAAFA